MSKVLLLTLCHLHHPDELVRVQDGDAAAAEQDKASAPPMSHAYTATSPVDKLGWLLSLADFYR